jgi:hypothetical protein
MRSSSIPTDSDRRVLRATAGGRAGKARNDGDQESREATVAAKPIAAISAPGHASGAVHTTISVVWSV